MVLFTCAVVRALRAGVAFASSAPACDMLTERNMHGIRSSCATLLHESDHLLFMLADVYRCSQYRACAASQVGIHWKLNGHVVNAHRKTARTQTGSHVPGDAPRLAFAGGVQHGKCFHCAGC